MSALGYIHPSLFRKPRLACTPDELAFLREHDRQKKAQWAANAKARVAEEAAKEAERPKRSECKDVKPRDPTTWKYHFDVPEAVRAEAPRWGDSTRTPYPDDGTRPYAPFMDPIAPDPDDYEESVISWDNWQAEAHRKALEAARAAKESETEVAFSRGGGIAYVTVGERKFTVVLPENQHEHMSIEEKSNK